ncbi:MAG: radical SAM protein [Candidatus Obscuribacterales bacterium]
MIDMNTVEVSASSILTPQRIGSLAGHYQYSLNPYAGCAFSCCYCYVPKFPSKRNDDYRLWGTWLEVKINAPELIRKERTRVFGSSIFFSSATDPYQYAELRYRLSRKCLQELLRYRPARVTMHTRSHLILQDLDLLQRFGPALEVGVSITTDDESIARQFEPRAPSIQRRLQILAALRYHGINAFASVSPLLPCNPRRLVALIEPYVDRAWVGSLSYPEINNRPDLLVRYRRFFEPDNYDRTRQFISARLSSGRRREIPGEPAPLPERSAQLKLAI